MLLFLSVYTNTFLNVVCPWQQRMELKPTRILHSRLAQAFYLKTVFCSFFNSCSSQYTSVCYGKLVIICLHGHIKRLFWGGSFNLIKAAYWQSWSSCPESCTHSRFLHLWPRKTPGMGKASLLQPVRCQGALTAWRSEEALSSTSFTQRAKLGGWLPIQNWGKHLV